MKFQNKTLLSNVDLEQMGNDINLNLVGVYAKDELKDIECLEGCYIINMDDSENQGTHWVALILNEKYISYFDSFGINLPEDVSYFIGRFSRSKNCIYNTKQIQFRDSILCGWYSFFFLFYHTIKNETRSDNKAMMAEHNNLYSDILKKNDKIIEKLIKEI